MVAQNKRINMKIIDRIKHAIHNYYVLYADSTEMLNKAQKLLQPLPQGCELVKLTDHNKELYKCTIGDIDKVLQFKGEAWGVVNNDNEIIAYHFGTYKGKKSLFFKVENCDFEHIEIIVDERFRRKGIALLLLYHIVKNLNFDDVNNKKLGTVIDPNNIPSIKLHELIGFKKSHRVIFISRRRKKNGRWSFINIPHYKI